MNEIPNHPVYSKNVFEFITVAHDYVETLKKSDTMTSRKIMDYLSKVLPLLYIKGSLLEEVTVTNPDANEKFFTEEEYEGLFNLLRKKFGKHDEFWFIEHNNPNNEVIKGSLAEHFSDIFQVLTDFLILYQKNSLHAKENAVADLVNSFKDHWGFRVVNAHKVIHYLFADLPPTTPEVDGFSLL